MQEFCRLIIVNLAKAHFQLNITKLNNVHSFTSKLKQKAN